MVRAMQQPQYPYCIRQAVAQEVLLAIRGGGQSDAVYLLVLRRTVTIGLEWLPMSLRRAYQLLQTNCEKTKLPGP